MASVFVADLV